MSVFCAWKIWAWEGCKPYRVPVPWQRAEKSSVSRTVISPTWRSCWLMYTDVFWGTNSSNVCPLYVIVPDICDWKTHQARDISVTDLPTKIAVEFSKSFMLDQTPTTDFGLIFNHLYFGFSPHTKKSLKSYTYIY
jgi:hypothetical protein